MRLPKRVVLPFGYVIKVKLVTDPEMRSILGEDEICDGLWQEGSRAISIRKCLPVTRQRYILSHEMGHAVIDWQHHFLGIMEKMKP